MIVNLTETTTPGVDATVEDWLRFRGLPVNIGLAGLLEHERINARLAGIFDGIASASRLYRATRKKQGCEVCGR